MGQPRLIGQCNGRDGPVGQSRPIRRSDGRDVPVGQLCIVSKAVSTAHS